MAHCTRTASRLSFWAPSFITKRSFASSRPWRRNGAWTIFPPTSSAELDAILEKFQNYVFYPNHLTLKQKRIIYAKRLHRVLTEEEPVEIELETYTPYLPGHPPPSPDAPSETTPSPPARETTSTRKVVLAPLDHQTDEPRFRSHYFEMLKLMTTQHDFNLLIDFFRELNLVQNLKKTPSMISATVRRVADADKPGLVLELFRRSNTTHLRMTTPDICHQAMISPLSHTVRHNWTSTSLRRALRISRNTELLLLNPNHCSIQGAHSNPTGTPQIAGIALALEAAGLLRLRESDEKTERSNKRSLAKWTQRALKRFGEADLGLPTPDAEEKPWKDMGKGWYAYNVVLESWAPVWAGAKLALQVLATDKGKDIEFEGQDVDDVKRSLQSMAGSLEEVIGQARDRIEKRNPRPDGGIRRGVWLHDALEKLVQGKVEVKVAGEKHEEAVEDENIEVDGDAKAEGEEETLTTPEPTEQKKEQDR